MADTTHTIGSTGIVKRLVDVGGGVYADASAQPLYPVAPVCTVYTPASTNYLKVTPNAANITMLISPIVTTETLQIAPIITHKIADTTTTIAAADPDDLPKSITAADEILADTNTHIASLTYHVAAGTAWYAGHKTDDVTRLIEAADMGEGDLAAGYTLYDELKADLIAHAASTTHHTAAVAVLTLPGTPNSEALLVAATNAMRLALVAHCNSAVAHSAADTINAALVTATAADAVNTAGCRTNLNLYKALSQQPLPRRRCHSRRPRGRGGQRQRRQGGHPRAHGRYVYRSRRRRRCDQLDDAHSGSSRYRPGHVHHAAARDQGHLQPALRHHRQQRLLHHGDVGHAAGVEVRRVVLVQDECIQPRVRYY